MYYVLCVKPGDRSRIDGGVIDQQPYVGGITTIIWDVPNDEEGKRAMDRCHTNVSALIDEDT